MVTITNGRETLIVTNGAYNDIFKTQGFYEASVETSSASVETRSGSGVKLPESTPENVSEGISDEKNGEPTVEVEPEPVKTEVDLSEIPLSEMTNDQLREYAKQLGIDLKGITSRKVVRDKIRSVL